MNLFKSIIKKTSPALAAFVAMAIPFYVKAQSLSLGLEYAGSSGLASRDLRDIVVSGIQIVLGLIGLILLVLVIYAGYLIMTAGGDETKIKKGKKIITSGVIGLIIVFSAYAIVTFVFGRLIDATGGGNGNNGGCTGEGCNTLGGGVNFQPAKIYPSGQLPIRNVVVNVRFNKNIKPESVTEKAVTIKRVTGETSTVDVPVSVSLAENNHLVIKPKTLCPNSTTAYCFDYDENDNSKNKYLINVAFNSADAVIDINGKKLTCLPAGRCQGDFIVGADVDLEGPKTDITELKNTLDPFEIRVVNTAAAVSVNGAFVVTAAAQDKSGVVDVSFYEKNSDNSFKFIGYDSTTELLNYFTAKSGPPGLWQTTDYAIDSQHTLLAVATDSAGNISTSTEAAITIRPRHCFNNQLDGEGDPDIGAEPDKPETAVDCGGVCGACAGVSCKKANEGEQCVPNNSACSSFSCDSQSCLCALNPEITEVSLNNGAPGNWVTIIGKNFGNTSGTVYIDGQQMDVLNDPNCSKSDNWNDNYIIVVVPEISQGVKNISLFTKGSLLSNRVEFTVNNIKRPGICSLDKAQYEIGQTFKISGQQFGTNTDARDVILGKVDQGISAENQVYKVAQVDAKVPNVQPGKMAVSVKVNNQSSNSLPIKINLSAENQLKILSVSPLTGAAGQYVTITGQGFGDLKADSQVFFAGNVPAEFDFPKQCGTSYWSNNQIIAKVPSVKTGSDLNQVVKIKVGTQTASSTDKFLIDNGLPVGPGLCSINPKSGEIGSEVEVAGDNLLNTSLKFNSANQGVTITGKNGGKYAVPSGSQTGDVKAINISNPALVSNPLSFEVKKTGSQFNGTADYYQWQFKTCADCYRPKVIVNRQCSNGEIASPTPRDGSKDNYINAVTSVVFDRAMDQESLNGDKVLTLENCGGGDEINVSRCLLSQEATLSAAVNGGQLNEPSTVVINKSDDLRGNIWYRIIISKDAKGLDGVSIGQPFIWSFKTRSDAGLCEVDKLSCTPPSFSLPFASTGNVAAYAYNSESCNICPNAGTWSWSPVNNSVIVTPGIGNLASVMGIAQDSNTGVKAANSVYNKLEAGMCKINVIAPAPKVVVDAKCDNDIQSPTPFVDATKICPNALIGIRFTEPMKPWSLTSTGAVSLKDEKNLSVTMTSVDYIYNEQGREVGVMYKPAQPLTASKKYNVILDPNILQSAAGVFLSPSSINNWWFTVGDSSNCQVKDVFVNPAKLSLPIGETKMYSALTVGNSCQLIDPPTTGWQWRSTAEEVATVNNSVSPKATVSSVGSGISYIRAKYANRENKGNNGLLMSSGTLDESFKITKVEPIGENICTNALARITFNRPVNPNSVRTIYVMQDANIKMAKIDGQSSHSVTISAIFSPDNSAITLVTNGNFDVSSKYSISVAGGDIGVNSFDGKKLTNTGCALTGLRWLDNGAGGSCAWDFVTSAKTCSPNSIIINPKNASMTVDDSQNWQASVYALDGTLLNDKSTWSVNDVAILSLIGQSVPSYTATSTAMSMGRTQLKAAVATVEQTADVEVKSKATGPLLSVVQPTSPPPVCLNSLIQAKFDSPINVASLNNNAAVVYQGDDCVGTVGHTLFNFNAKAVQQVLWLPRSSFNNTFYKLLSAATNYLGGKILNSITSIVAHRVLADDPWCVVGGTWQVTDTGGEQEVVFTQSAPLPPNSTVRVVFNGGENGIKGVNELSSGITPGITELRNFSDDQYGWEFSTSNSICKVAYVDVYSSKGLNKKDWAFSRSDNDTSDDYPSCSALVCDRKSDGDKVFEAVAKSENGVPVISIDNVYSWRWSWDSSDLSVAGVGTVEKPAGTVLTDKQVVRAENKNGDANITATAVFSPKANQSPIVGTAKVTVFLCANPWPKVDGEWQPLNDNKYNFSFFYCRDSGVAGEQDDLPELKIPGQNNPVKQPTFLSSNNGRVLPVCQLNEDALQYCKIKGFSGVNKVVIAPDPGECVIYTGNPVQWQYISSGRIISSLNCLSGNNYIDYTTGKVGDNDMLRQYLLEVPGTSGDAVALRVYENNYQNNSVDWYKYNVANPGTPNVSAVISGYNVAKDNRSSYVAFANQDDPVTSPNKAKALTLVTSYNQDASKETVSIVNQIMGNIKFNTNIISDDVKDKLVRDFKRVSDLQSMATALYKTYISNSGVPTLSGGTFVPGITLSNWPSWQQTLAGSLKMTMPNDPVNKFGACSDCVNPSNYNTDFEGVNDLGSYQTNNSSVDRICNSGVAAAQGNCYAKVIVDSGSNGDGINRNITLSADTVYRVTAKIYMSSTTPDVLVQLMNGDGLLSKDFVVSHSIANEWKDVSFELKTGQKEDFALNFFSNTAENPTFLIDDVKIQAVSGHCADFDPATCWNPKANNGAGEFSCSSNSYSYLYKYNKAEAAPALRGKFYALTELVSNWLDDSGGINSNLDSKVNLLAPNSKLPVCTNASMGVECGDGVVNSPEVCEIGDSQPFCDAGKNWYNSAVNLCENSGVNACKLWKSPLATAGVCAGKTAAQCCGGYCGDSVLNKKPNYRIDVDEQCDSSVNGTNVQKGFGDGNSPTNQYACSQTCHDVGGYCGDSTVQNQYGEQCDGTVGLSAWTCSNGATPTCSGCRVACSGGTPYRGLCGNNVIENGEQCDYCGNGLQSTPGQGECTGKSATSQYFCTKPGAGQCKWTGGYCGDGVEQNASNPVEGRAMEYCDKAANYSSLYKVNKCTDDCQNFSCTVGYFDCDAQSSNGCEIEGAKGLWVTKNTVNAVTPPNINAPTANDIANKELINCGGCAGSGGVTCAWVPNSAPMCNSGKCQLNCLNGFTDENNNYNDGCEKIGSILSGKVKKQGDGASLSGATIMLFNDLANDKSLVGTTTTNTSGDYTIIGLEKGKYTVMAYKRGFYSQKNPLIITVGGTTTKDFSLLSGDKTINVSVQRINSGNGQIVPYTGQAINCILDLGDGVNLDCGSFPANNSQSSYSFSNLEKNGHYIVKVAPTDTTYYTDEHDFGALSTDGSYNFVMNKCGDGLVAAGKEICDGGSSVYSCSDLMTKGAMLTPAFSSFVGRDWDGYTSCKASCQEYNFAGLSLAESGYNYTMNLNGQVFHYKHNLDYQEGGDCSYGPPKSGSDSYHLIKTEDIWDVGASKVITVNINKPCWFRTDSAYPVAGDDPWRKNNSDPKGYSGSVFLLPPTNEKWYQGTLKSSGTGASTEFYCSTSSYSGGTISANNANRCSWSKDSRLWGTRICWLKNN